ncbi:hypothetical protein RI054_03g16950 [Pseudoscourfieldia marina]
MPVCAQSPQIAHTPARPIEIAQGLLAPVLQEQNQPEAARHGERFVDICVDICFQNKFVANVGTAVVEASAAKAGNVRSSVGGPLKRASMVRSTRR